MTAVFVVLDERSAGWPDQSRQKTTIDNPIETYFVVESDKYTYLEAYSLPLKSIVLISMPDPIFPEMQKTRHFSGFLAGGNLTKTKYSDSLN
jgi:hypothetical protein